MITRFRQMAVHLALFAVLLLTAAVYWVGLNGPLVFDDAQNLAPMAQWLQGKSGWESFVFGNRSGMLGRPVSMASFLLNATLIGPEVWALKLGNLLLHLLNGVLVYALFSGLLRHGAMTREPPAAARWLPLLGAALWLLHPLLVSTVLYVVQRMAMLAASFMLLAMLAYLQGRWALREGNIRRALLLLAVAVPLCTVLAALSKENGMLAPALCALIELFAFAPRVGQRRHWASTAFIVLALAVPALLVAVLTIMQHPIIVGGYANRSFTLDERVLTQVRVLWSYVAALLLPYGPQLGFYHDDYPISRGLFVPATTAFALLAWAIVLAAAWRLRRRVPGFGLGVGIFLVGQALESSVFPLLMYFEHRNYLPAIGAIWALLSLGALAAPYLQRHMHHGPRVFVAGAVSIVLVLAVATASRAGIWQTQDALLAQGLAYHPNSRWLRMDLIKHAIEQTPPNYALARLHSDALQRSDEPSARRLGGVSRLLVDCGDGVRVEPASVSLALDGHADVIEADLLIAYESLSEGVLMQACQGLSTAEMARRLSALLDRSTLPATDASIGRLRLKAAKLYLADGRHDEALQQARLADAGGTADAPVPMFIAALLLQRNDLAGAASMLDAAERRIAKDDVTGRALLAQYRAEIQRRH